MANYFETQHKCPFVKDRNMDKDIKPSDYLKFVAV